MSGVTDALRTCGSAAERLRPADRRTTGVWKIQPVQA